MRDRYVDFDRMPMRRGVVGSADQWSAGYVVELVVRIALVALFIWAVALLVKYLVKYLNAKSGTDAVSAEGIAKKRYASGEITKSEYDQLKKDLK